MRKAFWQINSHAVPHDGTWGNSSAPNTATINLDALFATSLANYRNTLTDNISQSNPFFYELKSSGLWEPRDGGAYIAEDLMYELGQFDSYDGYDELGDTPTDGITQVQFDWRQGAVPITYSEKERKQNKHRLVNLVESKIQQAEMGFNQGFKKALLLGALSQGSGNIYDPYISALNGSYFIDPLPRIIAYDPTSSMSIGNLDQNSYSWWRNWTKTSAATTYSALLLEMDHMMNNCSRGPGGRPNLILCDQTTYELINAAYYQKYLSTAPSDGKYPFDNIMFRGAHIVWDEDVPNVDANSTDTTATTGGTMYFINTKFFKVVYESETNFVQTPFVKPPKGDSRLAHILWMGQVTTNNRRKHGVIGKVARTLTA